ncbi:MAG TPA: hypothetical protein VI814_05540 [Candidatus Limnocylindria bacterium]
MCASAAAGGTNGGNTAGGETSAVGTTGAGAQGAAAGGATSNAGVSGAAGGAAGGAASGVVNLPSTSTQRPQGAPWALLLLLAGLLAIGAGLRGAAKSKS